ncbi:MAG: GGDEF domain-containing protein [Yoonia sp.]
MNTFLRFLVPRHARGIAARGSVVVCLIVLSNLGFVYAVYGYFPQPVLFYGMQAIAVGTPFVITFTWVSVYQVKLQRDLSLLSRKDGLTGLNNRRTFLELAEKRLKQDFSGVLLLLDADHFKKINDTWGHAAGDVCLEEIAHRMKWNLRPDDVAGRVDGEEFGVLLSGATLHQARVIAHRIGQPITFVAGKGDRHQSVTLSIGGVQIEKGVSLETHINRADDALYKAKKEGRACLRIWAPPTHVAQRSA